MFNYTYWTVPIRRGPEPENSYLNHWCVIKKFHHLLYYMNGGEIADNDSMSHTKEIIDG
jgi:hypothetical protein